MLCENSESHKVPFCGFVRFVMHAFYEDLK